MPHLHQVLAGRVAQWRADGYPADEYPAIAEILEWATDADSGTPRFLKLPQIRALETYWYLRTAVEAQAIDRTHRIGQPRPVFAYRLIAKDTVEEKVLELQASKRELADAIVSADEGPMRGLTREDLERLLS